ncbi:MAG: hypothetical protein AABX54_02195 [Nanoarchaeota archaeon]
MQYWNSDLTEKSWILLQELQKKYNFILIGGWATYLWTKQQKSKDIDIIVDLKELEKLKQENLIKNDRLKKYEIKFEEIDVDIYVPYFSKLTIPIEKIKNYNSKLQGFNVLSKEALLILKQGAELDRRNSIKGEKDRIDIISLLFFTDFDYKIYKSILKENSKEFLLDELIKLIRNFNDYNSLNLAPNEFKKIKKKITNRTEKINTYLY